MKTLENKKEIRILLNSINSQKVVKVRFLIGSTWATDTIKRKRADHFTSFATWSGGSDAGESNHGLETMVNHLWSNRSRISIVEY